MSISAFLEDLLVSPIMQITVAIAITLLVATVIYITSRPKMARLVVRNLSRNKVRTSLTCLAIMALVLMVTLIGSVLDMLNQATRDKAADFKIIVTDRWNVPSLMPMSHANYLNPESSQYILPKQLGIGPNDFMVWSFYGGTTDPAKMSPENIVYMFALNPRSIMPMMDDIDDLDPALPQKLIDNPRGCLLGRDRLENLNKKVGDRFTLISLNFKGIDLEFEVLGELPPGRYDKFAMFNVEYLNNEIDKYNQKSAKKHPMDEKRLNLIWMRVKDKAAFEEAATAIENSEYFSDRPVRCDIASSAIGNFLEAYKDILWFATWVLVPAILICIALVLANAISITVRERRAEMAVLKVLGYPPNQILFLVMGESLLIGGLSGLIAGLGAIFIVNFLIGGIAFPIAFFPVFFVPAPQAAFWGVAMGAVTGFLGCFIPAYQARSVKVSEVFAKVA